MFVRQIANICVALFCSLALQAQQTDFAGSLKTFEGVVTIYRGGASVPALLGLHLKEKDRIVSAAQSRVSLILRDGTRISIGPNTEFILDQFAYQPQEGAFALVMQLMRGALVYVSGKIASFAPSAVKLETPSGSIGLRGTEFAITLEPQ
ncbi:MAG: FecR family protein [Acidobacteria bacterium]|nr:FecR family protein [Acidobacteriota bacterium]